MAKLESSIKNMVMSLTFVSLIASALLAGAYALTKEPIEKAKQDNTTNAIKEVLPDKDCQVGDIVEIKLDGYETPFIIHPATKNGELTGAAIETYCTEGYGGTLKVMVGMDNEGTISNYSILETSETPGLGAKAGEWFKAKGDIRGKNPGKINFTVKKDGGDIDAITASTITSRAFLKSVQCAFDAFKQYQNK